MEPPSTPERCAGWLTPKDLSLLDPAEFPGKVGEDPETTAVDGKDTQSFPSLHHRQEEDSGKGYPHVPLFSRGQDRQEELTWTHSEHVLFLVAQRTGWFL